LPLVAGYLGVRFVGKWLGCRIGCKCFRLPFEPTRWLGMGLVAQGGQALALLIDLALAETARAVPRVPASVIMLVETVVILSIIASVMPARNAARLTINEVLAYE